MATSTPTYDYESEQQSIARQRQIAEAMLQGGLAPMGPTQMVGGVAVRQSPLEGLAKVMQAYLGREGIQTADAAQRNLGSRYKADLSAGMSRFIDGISAQPGQQPAQTGNNPSAYVAPTTDTPADAAGKQRAAILEAIGSGHPVLQQLGMSQLQQLQKSQVTAKDLLPYARPDAIPSMVRNGAAGFQPKANVKEVNGVVYDADTMKVLQLNGQPPGRITIGGDLYEVNPSTMQLKKLDNSPKVTVSNQVTPIIQGQRAGMAEWARKAADTVDSLSTAARQGNKLLGQLSQLEQLTAAGTNNGPLAGAATFVQGLAKAAGIPVDATKLNNSQAFDSVATQAWAALMQQNGGARGLVKEESEKLAQSLPALVQTPAGRAQIIATLRRAAQQDIANAAQANREFGKAVNADNPELFTFGLGNTIMPNSPPITPPAGSVTPGQPTVKNW